MEYRKNYKRRSALPRKIIASGLSAAFCAGTVGGSYAGATEPEGQVDCLFKKEELDDSTLQGQFKLWVNDEINDFLPDIPDKGELLRILLGVNAYNHIASDSDPDFKDIIKELSPLFPTARQILAAYVEHFLSANIKRIGINIEALKEYFKYDFGKRKIYLFIRYFLDGFEQFRTFFNGLKTVKKLLKEKGIETNENMYEDDFVKEQGIQEQDPQVQYKKYKINWKYIIIISIIVIIVVTTIVILILTLGSKGKEINQNTQNGNNNSNEGENTNTPGKNKNGNGTKQNDSEDSGILAKSLVTIGGAAGGIGAKFAADEILDHGEQGGNNGNSKNGKNSQKDQKNRDSNGLYTYIDSTVKVISKAEVKGVGDNKENANTDVPDTEQPETPNEAENETEKAEETNKEKGYEN